MYKLLCGSICGSTEFIVSDWTEWSFCQEEERDSSDEEWDIAYAAMDPVAQLGWGHRRMVSAGGEDMVRDVFVAADAVHAAAMSAMDANKENDDHSGDNGLDGVGESAPMTVEGSVEADDGDFLEMEGMSGEYEK